MKHSSQYWEWPALEHYYLEDSYVLSIRERACSLRLDMEFVLRETHPEYRVPDAEKQYCYRRGRLVFGNPREVRWLERRDVKSSDATGDSDLGNVDTLCIEDGKFKLSGDWGSLELVADALQAQLDRDRE